MRPGALHARPAGRAAAETPVRPSARRGAEQRRGACAADRPPPSAGSTDRVMRPNVALRELALAAIALLAAVGALAVTERTRSHTSKTPQPEGSYRALAGSSGPAAFGRQTACGGVLRAETEGVAHPTLPCGARIFITYNGHDGADPGGRPRPVQAGARVRPHRRARAPARVARRAGDPVVVCPSGVIGVRCASVLDGRSRAAHPCRTNTM